MIEVFTGSPENIGRMHGICFKDQILYNLKTLVWDSRVKDLYANDSDFPNWLRKQEKLISAEWGWILDEMRSIAEAVGTNYRDILLLNLRSWQYPYYKAVSIGEACSSLIVTMNDGTVACAGTLDDPIELYCGPVKIVPNQGYRFITFPIAGTCWGNRGMNSEGLSVGISSQLLPGIKQEAHTISQDIAMRVILQTCAYVDEVREFCRHHPFTMNLMCVDATGATFCAQQTTAGLFEMPSQGFAALTNHVADDGWMYRFKQLGVTRFIENETTRDRRGNLLEFARKFNGKCSQTDLINFIGTRDDANPGSVHNKDTIFLTYSNPQANKNKIWIKQPQNSVQNDIFLEITI